MSDLVQKIDGIEWKIQKLAQKMKLLKKENSALLEENLQQKTELEGHKKNIYNLEAQLSRTRETLESSHKNGSGSSKLLKEEIDQYISEIDKCLEWLQSM
jgi:uncharacterized coiled-coil DUF342 family protein